MKRSLAGLLIIGSALVCHAQTRRTQPVDRVTQLITQLHSANQIMRANAACSLGDTKDPGASTPLIAALEDSDISVTQCASESLVKIGSPALIPLLVALKSSDAKTRADVAHILGLVKDPRAADALFDALSDPDKLVRRNSALALAALKDARAVDSLIAMLKGLSDFGATDALGQIGAPAVSPLIALLSDPNWSVRKLAAEALGKIGAPAIDALISATSSSVPTVKFSAAQALGQIKDPRATGFLLHALAQHDTTEIAGAYVFFIQLGQPGSEDDLIAALSKYSDLGGDLSMPVDFLNSGNPKLEAAATTWATNNHYEATTMHLSGEKSATWGKKP